MLGTPEMLSLFIAGGALLVGIILTFYRYQFRYWKRKDIFFIPPTFPMGNGSGICSKMNIGHTISSWYQKTKQEPFVGVWIMFKPILLVNDPELIKSVLVRDFNKFHDRGIYNNTETDPLSGHLFLMEGVAWRNLRVKLTPTFTSGKMKMMFQTMDDSAEDLRSYLKTITEVHQVVEVKDLLARFTTDIIASCAFGLTTNSIKNPNCEFRQMGKKFFDVSLLDALKLTVNFFLPSVAQIFKFKIVPNDVEKFFLSAVTDTIAHREQYNINRNDFLQLMIQLKNKGHVDDADMIADQTTKADNANYNQFTILEAAAQAFVFFVAGFETSSTTMQFALYELALHPEIQNTVREEINKVINKFGRLTYDGVMEMEYLDRVVAETLRKYPPLPFLSRQANEDYQIPGSHVIIEQGTIIQISVLGLHHNSKYYKEPEVFDPERFTEEEKMKRPQYVYLPFGDGPRNCIGNRFGLLQSKIGLITILRDYIVQISEKTPTPLIFDPKSIVLSPVGGMHLKLSPIK